jgi:HPt (histidine-containing phosphotransfer) domain-containing protein
MQGDREQCLAAGMDGYLAKPIQADALRQAIAKLVPEHARQDRHAAPADVNVEPPPVLDLPAMLATVDGDRDLLAELIDMFLGESAAMLEAVRTAVTAGDAPALHRAAHALKGAVQIFGARQVYNQAHKLEVMGQKRMLTQMTEVFSALEQSLARVRNDLGLVLQNNP